MGNQVADRRDAQDPSKQDNPNTEEKRAIIHGWKPKDEYAGKPEDWVEAKVFNQRADSSMAIKNERMRKLEEDVSTLTNDKTELLNGQTELKSTLDEFVTYHKDVAEREYKKAVTDIESKKREAAADGDIDAYEALEEEEKGLEPPKEEAKDKEGDQPGVDPALKAWVAKNDWYYKDQILNIQMQAEHALLSKTEPGLSLEENLEKAKKNLMERFPKEFGLDPAKEEDEEEEGEEEEEEEAVQAVESGRAPSGKKGKKTYANLPAEAKTSCDRFVTQGLLTQEQYVKDYEWTT